MSVSLRTAGRVAGCTALAAFSLFLAYPGFAKSPVPPPDKDIPVASGSAEQTAVLAGGCFWGVEGVFAGLKGVNKVTSGYAGGAKNTAHYEQVGSGATGHAESVEIKYDPSQITYGQLLRVFFSVAHDPTELNRQGPDEGTQYRSSIFYTSDEQQKLAEAYIAQLNQTKSFHGKIVTKVVPLNGFYAAESYHQQFMKKNPGHPYIMVNDAPKVAALRKEFPELLKAK